LEIRQAVRIDLSSLSERRHGVDEETANAIAITMGLRK